MRVLRRNRFMTILIWFGICFFLLVLTAGFFMSRMPGQSFQGPPRSLAENQIALRQNLFSHIQALAEDIGERHVWRPEKLEAAADYIEKAFSDAGYHPESYDYSVAETTVRNIVAEHRGEHASSGVYIVGAHYDTVPGTPGANDNATGVAALIELARALQKSKPSATIRFVAFVNEEPPFFKTKQMGSRVYARTLKSKQAQIAGMISLETIGYFRFSSNSQRFPMPLLRLFYPNRGEFIAFVGNVQSRHFLKKTLRLFRKVAKVQSEGIVAPAWLTGVDWSDHWSFWEEGWPALMVTDTALFRYPYYHTNKDTPEQIDYDALTQVVSGLSGVLAEL